MQSQRQKLLQSSSKIPFLSKYLLIFTELDLYMDEDKVFFNGFESSLKSMESVKSDERYFEGLLTVQMKDKQGEVTIVDELYKVLPIWIDRGAPISDTHSNRIVGRGINYARTVVKNDKGEELPAIRITGKIFKNYELDNVIWNKIKSGEYKGLSFGGATRTNRAPIVMKDGSIAYALKDLEHYEVAVCKDPAVPMALITDFNPIAKAEHSATDRGDGKMVIQCSKMGCYVEKAEDPCWEGYEQVGMKEKDGKQVPNCVPKGDTKKADEDKPLNKPMRDDGDKKFKVYVRDPSTGNVVTVRFGDPNMEIKRDDPERRASFRARHDCDNAKDITTPQYWSCKMWEKETSVTEYTEKNIEDVGKADLTQYDSFEGKVEALMKEGYPRENAEKIVGAFVKGEKKKDGEGGAMSTSTDGVFNAVHNGKKKKGVDHSNSDGDLHGMYNQNGSNLKKEELGGYFSGERESYDRTSKQGGMDIDSGGNITQKITKLKKSKEDLLWAEKTFVLKRLHSSLKYDIDNYQEEWDKEAKRHNPDYKSRRETEIQQEWNKEAGRHAKPIQTYKIPRSSPTTSSDEEWDKEARRHDPDYDKKRQTKMQQEWDNEAKRPKGGEAQWAKNLTNHPTNADSKQKKIAALPQPYYSGKPTLPVNDKVLPKTKSQLLKALLELRKRKFPLNPDTREGQSTAARLRGKTPDPKMTLHRTGAVGAKNIIEESKRKIKKTNLNKRFEYEEKLPDDGFKQKPVEPLHTGEGSGYVGAHGRKFKTREDAQNALSAGKETTNRGIKRKERQDPNAMTIGDRLERDKKIKKALSQIFKKYRQGNRYTNTHEVVGGYVPYVHGTTLREGKPRTEESKRRGASTKLLGGERERKTMANFKDFQQGLEPKSDKELQAKKLEEERANRIFND